MAALIIGAFGVLIAFFGLEFWWKADTDLRHERERRIELERTLRSFPTLPTTFVDTDAAAAVLLWKALAEPNIEVLCAADTMGVLDDRMDAVLEILDPRTGHAIARRPGEIRLANGSRILFRYGGSNGRGFKGLDSRATWWAAAGEPPEELLEASDRGRSRA